jgi:predicted permease
MGEPELATEEFVPIVRGLIPYATILGATLPVFLVMAAGFWLRRAGRMTPEGDSTLLTLTISFTYPCYILRALVDNPALREPGNVLPPILCGAGFVLAGLLLGWLAGPLCGLRKGSGRRTFALACSVQNYGYLPIPIMEVLFPAGEWKGVLFVFTLGIELTIWSVGVMILSGDWRRGLRQAMNPVTLAVVAGVGLNALHLDTWFPVWALHFLSMAGECAIPLGLLVSGAMLADLLRQPGSLADWKTLTGAVSLRLAVLPALILATAHWLPLTSPLRQVLAIQAAMPAAVFPLIMARRYGGHELTAVRVLVFTTVVSFFTIPLVVAVALRLNR